MPDAGVFRPSDAIDQDVRIAVASSVIGVESGSAAFVAALRRRFAPFLTEGRPVFTIHHQATPGGRPHEPAATRCTVEIDLPARTARLAAEEGPAGLDGVIRLVLPALLSPSLVVHAALLGDGRRCWLCCGSSGAGKSTLARLAGELALCDELAAVDTRDGRVVARSLPFTAARPGMGELVEVLLLEHGPEHCRTPLERDEALRRLSAHVCWPQQDGTTAGAAFHTLVDLVERVPVARLSFRPDRGVVELITRGA